MGPVQSIKTCLRKFASVSGRASRSEYWWFAAFTGLFGFLILFMTESIGVNLASLGRVGQIAQGFGLITLFLLIAPNASAFVRRYHDAGYSGWVPLTIWIMAALLVQINFFIESATAIEGSLFSALLIAAVCLGFAMVFFLFLPSDPNPNLYGPNPHEVTP